jgi:hypothetical protein
MSGCGCGCGGHGGAGCPQTAQAAVQGPIPPIEPWWSPRSAPDAADFQMDGLCSSHMASLFVGAGQYVNTGMQGGYREFWIGDAAAANVDLVRRNMATVRAVPADQTTLITGRPSVSSTSSVRSE